MFTLTNERQFLIDAAYCFDFDEPVEDAEIRYEQLHMFLRAFPENIQLAIQTKTLLQKQHILQQLQTWSLQIIDTIGAEMNASHENRSEIIQKLSPTGARIFSQSLHDAEILLAEQRGEHFVMLLDTAGGFTVEALVQLTFENAQMTGTFENFYVYDELIETNEGFGLRILSSDGYPFVEATLYFTDVQAEYYYRPSIYVEPEGIETLEDFVAALPQDDRYIIVEDKTFVPITLSDITTSADGIFAGMYFLGENFEAASECIYCATYKDPYAHFSEEVAIDDLYTAVFDEDQTMKVRAFNTIFARGEEVAAIVNMILEHAKHNEDDMYFSIMASHFEKLGCLHEKNRIKWDT